MPKRIKLKHSLGQMAYINKQGQPAIGETTAISVIQILVDLEDKRISVAFRVGYRDSDKQFHPNFQYSPATITFGKSSTQQFKAAFEKWGLDTKKRLKLTWTEEQLLLMINEVDAVQIASVNHWGQTTPLETEEVDEP